MKTRRKTKLGTLAALLLALLVAAGVCGPTGVTYAGGSATVQLTSIEGLDNGTEFTFNLYKVGSWGRNSDGEPILILDEELASAAMVDPAIVNDGTEACAAKLLESSKNVGNYIKAHAGDYTPVATKTIASGGSAVTFDGLTDNGLYILVGDSTVVRKKTWTPTSVYIDILNGEKKMTIGNVKMSWVPVIDEYSVQKIWNDEEGQEKYRPTEIKVEITFGSTLVDTVTLNEENDWRYDWKVDESDESADAKVIYFNDAEDKSTIISDTLSDDNDWTYTFDRPEDDPVWHVSEVSDASLSRYTADVTDPTADSPGTFSITNTYAVTELQITKEIDGYVDSGSGSNVTVGFNIVGKVGDVEVYHNTAGVQFTKGGALTETATLSDIPINVDSIEVTESYVAGYKPDPDWDPVVALDESDGIWKVTFKNIHQKRQGSGVINKYENNENTEQQGLLD